MAYGLRIKKVYFDQILSGEKKCEYRSVSPRYRGLLKATEIMLHYQRPRRLLAKIIAIDIVPTASVPELVASGIDFGREVYCIRLSNPCEFEQA